MSSTNYLRFALFLTALLIPGSRLRAAEIVLKPQDRLLILAAHPDDEVLGCGGLIQEALRQQLPVQIVYLTYGDYNEWAFVVYRKRPIFRSKTMRAMGEVRGREALEAALVLGLKPEHLIFLGYPDMGTLSIWEAHWGSQEAFESDKTHSLAVPYQSAYRFGAPYKGESILEDLTQIVGTFKPTKIFFPHPADVQTDHYALYLFTNKVLETLPREDRPSSYFYLVHFPKWPKPRGLYMKMPLTPPPVLGDSFHWASLTLTPEQLQIKWDALKKHQTQYGYSAKFLNSFIRQNELFAEEQP